MTKPPSKDHSDRPRPGGMREDGADERAFFADQPPEQPLRGKRQGGAGEKDTRHVHGHRDRLRARFRENGANALADYEILELLLFRLIPRRDTKPVAKALIDRFGSLGGVFGAPPELLQEVSGIGESVAFDLKLISALAQRNLKNTLKERQVLGSWSSVIDYCNAAMAHETREQFRILFLDKRNKLIADEIQGIGTVDHTPVYPREVVKRALELSATAIILVHNHPSGDPSPSRADIDMTHMIISSAKPLGITVHDHIIIGRDGYVSFKGLKLI